MRAAVGRALATMGLLALAASARADAISPPEALAEFERALQEFDEGQRLLAEQPERARPVFRSAAQRFSSLIAGGFVNGRLEFNLANSYLQAGDVGRAILHYRRGERMIPGDPLLQDNLASARARCLTQIPPARRDAVLRSLFFWHYETSPSTRIRAALFLYVVAFFLLTVRSLISRSAVTWSAAVAGVLALSCGGSVMAEQWSQRNAGPAVVTTMDVVVYKGPGAGYQRQFEQPLQPGVECVIRERRGGWWRMELPDGKNGWIESSTVELVSPETEFVVFRS